MRTQAALTGVLTAPSGRTIRPVRVRDEPLDERTWCKRIRVVIWLAVSAALLASAAAALAALLRSEPDPGWFRGVRLGMSADQVRARFDAGAPASWRTEISGTDVALVRGPAGSLDREARFEFHDGMLVAMRLDLPASAPEARGEAVLETPAAVIARASEEPGRVRLVALARGCPTHADEVARILAARR